MTASVSEVHELVRRHQSSGRALLYAMAGANHVEVAAEGAWVLTDSGERYLDLGSYAVFLFGHRHPRIVHAIEKQLLTLSGSSRAFPSEVNARACEALAGIAPPGLSKVMLLNSGAEAVEAAIKLARVSTGRSAFVHLEGSFHGKTAGALSLTDAEVFRQPVGSLLNDVHRISRTDTAAAVDAVRRLSPAAVFVEPVQGEGGAFELAPPYLKALRQACDDARSLLVFDEVQCGLGRCGTTWACLASGVSPDVLLSGKALGGGIMPVSALIATRDAFTPFDKDPLLHTSTFGGNPLASAAVQSSLELVKDEDVPGRAEAIGLVLQSILRRLCTSFPGLFSNVSGRGLLLGLRCGRPDIAGEFVRACLRQRLLVTPCLTSPSVVRLTPPAFLSKQDLAFACEGLQAAALLAQRSIGED